MFLYTEITFLPDGGKMYKPFKKKMALLNVGETQKIPSFILHRIPGPFCRGKCKAAARTGVVSLFDNQLSPLSPKLTVSYFKAGKPERLRPALFNLLFCGL